jgi:hypothetical protein
MSSFSRAGTSTPGKSGSIPAQRSLTLHLSHGPDNAACPSEPRPSEPRPSESSLPDPMSRPCRIL